MIDVEVAFATPEKQIILTVTVLPNATVEDAILASGILKEFPEIDMQTIRVGIFSRSADIHTRLKPKDRVEIYRPLTIDPKDARRRRLRDRAAK